MPDHTNLTVEEAADQLQVSVATIRRWCKSGRLAAEKSGRQWVVDGSKLPRIKRTSGGARPSPASGLDLERSLAQLKAVDLKEVWVPDALRHEDWLAAFEELLGTAAGKLDGTLLPDPVEEVDVPKTPVFTRGAAMLSLPDRLALHSAVASIAGRVESLLMPEVFSARLSQDPSYLLKKGRDQWVKWKDAVLAEVDSGSTWVVKTDITSYFDNIQLRLLFGDVGSLNPDARVNRAFTAMLKNGRRRRASESPNGPMHAVYLETCTWCRLIKR